MPDVPALAEQGFPGFSALAWWGIFGVTGTPKPILDKFHAELVKVFNLVDVRKELAETLGMDLVVGTPEALQKFYLRRSRAGGKSCASTRFGPTEAFPKLFPSDGPVRTQRSG
jgi:tripartite-type tricarboxylate transporter receptor subunit TctC